MPPAVSTFKHAHEEPSDSTACQRGKCYLVEVLTMHTTLLCLPWIISHDGVKQSTRAIRIPSQRQTHPIAPNHMSAIRAANLNGNIATMVVRFAATFGHNES